MPLGKRKANKKLYRKGSEQMSINKLEDLATYEQLPQTTNKVLIEFLREQIDVVSKKADMNKRIFVACFNTILHEIEKRLGIK